MYLKQEIVQQNAGSERFLELRLHRPPSPKEVDQDTRNCPQAAMRVFVGHRKMARVLWGDASFFKLFSNMALPMGTVRPCAEGGWVPVPSPTRPPSLALSPSVSLYFLPPALFLSSSLLLPFI